MNKKSLKLIASIVGFLLGLVAIVCGLFLQKGTFQNTKMLKHEGNYFRSSAVTSISHPLNLVAPMTMESTPIAFKGGLFQSRVSGQLALLMELPKYE